MGDRQTRDRWSTCLVLAAALLIASCGGGSSTPTASPTPAPPLPSAVVVLHVGNFDATVAFGVSLVEFYHPACPHCRAMEPVVEQLATDFGDRAVVGKVDVTVELDLTRTWGVHGYPTFIVLRDGDEQGRWLGETSYARLAGMVRSALDAS